MRFLIIFTFLISHALANEVPNIKNIVINKELKTYNNITFLDSNEKLIKLIVENGSGFDLYKKVRIFFSLELLANLATFFEYFQASTILGNLL